MRWARRRKAEQESDGAKKEQPQGDMQSECLGSQTNLTVVQAQVRTNQRPGGFRRAKDQFVEEFDEEKDINHK